MGSLDEEDLILSLDCWPLLDDTDYNVFLNRTVASDADSVSHRMTLKAGETAAAALGTGAVKSARITVDMEVYDAEDKRNVRCV